FSLSSKESKNDIVEDCQHFRCMSHAQLCMILAQGHITPIVESIFNAPVSSCQFQKSLRIGQMSRKTGYPIAHLRFGFPQGIGTVAFQLEHLSQLRPVTIIGKKATDGDRSFVEASMPFLNRACTAKIHRRCRRSWPLALTEEERFNVRTQAGFVVFDRAEVLSRSSHHRRTATAACRYGRAPRNDSAR